MRMCIYIYMSIYSIPMYICRSSGYSHHGRLLVERTGGDLGSRLPEICILGPRLIVVGSILETIIPHTWCMYWNLEKGPWLGLWIRALKSLKPQVEKKKINPNRPGLGVVGQRLGTSSI